MIRRLALVLPLLFAAPALAQQPDPVQTLAQEFDALHASLTTANTADAHVVMAIRAFVADYQRQKAELDKAKADNAALEAQKAELVEWLKRAQAQHAE